MRYTYFIFLILSIALLLTDTKRKHTLDTCRGHIDHTVIILFPFPQLDQHIEEVCPKTKMICEFEYIGCTHRVGVAFFTFA